MVIELTEARQKLLELTQVMPVEEIPLAACWQRVLAEAVMAEHDFPPFDRSPLDGYAVIANEVLAATASNPAVLTEIDNVPTGTAVTHTVTSGTACRIMTGAPIPPGATGVVRLEDTKVSGKNVLVLTGDGAEKNICRRGEEIAAGEQVIAAGTVIKAAAMGMLAALGKAAPKVYKQPRVALIATGSELLAVEKPLAPGKIRNSNSYMLSAQVLEAGGQPVMLGMVSDNLKDIAALLKQAETDAQLCLTTGGASGGDYDLISEAFRQHGVEILFQRVRMKPGMPVVAGVKKGKLFIGLSGNPAAASIAFEQIVRPVLLKMCGRKNLWRQHVKAVLEAPFCKASPSKRFVWARCWHEHGQWRALPLGLQGNGMLKSALAANGLICLDNSPPVVKGSFVDVMLLNENS